MRIATSPEFTRKNSRFPDRKIFLKRISLNKSKNVKKFEVFREI